MRLKKSKHLFTALLLMFTTVTLAYEFNADNIDNDPMAVVPTANPIHNLTKDTLRILDIGNSYTDDATHYLSQIAAAAGAKGGFSLYKTVRGSAGFKSWIDIYNDADTENYKIARVCGDKVADIPDYILGNAGDGSHFRNALEKGEWDIILIHQVSSQSANFELWGGNSYNGFLKELITILRETNPQATVGFHLIHSYSDNYRSNVHKSSLVMWENIAEAIKKLKLNYDIDFVVPYGTAVENLRASHFNDGNDLSTDGAHLADGLGDYVAACCYWETVFAPRFGSILGNTFRLDTLDENTVGVKNITEETAAAAQRVAILATRNMFGISNIDSFDIYMQKPAEYQYFNNCIISHNYNEPVGNVIIPDGVSGISRGVFNGCKGISNLCLSANMTFLGHYAFNDCTNIETITSPIPQDRLFAIDTTVFGNVDKNACTLYVPYGAKETYSSTAGWSEFTNIVELEPGEGETTGIDEEKGEGKGSKAVYDLQGRKVEIPNNGIYIIDGKKIIVK